MHATMRVIRKLCLFILMSRFILKKLITIWANIIRPYIDAFGAWAYAIRPYKNPHHQINKLNFHSSFITVYPDDLIPDKPA